MGDKTVKNPWPLVWGGVWTVKFFALNFGSSFEEHWSKHHEKSLTMQREKMVEFNSWKLHCVLSVKHRAETYLANMYRNFQGVLYKP